MKILDLDFLKPSDVKKLSKCSEMTIEEFINWFNNLQNPNKFYKNIYNIIIDNKFDKRSVYESDFSAENNEVLKVLNEIPLDEIRFYVDAKEFSKYNRSIRSKKNITTLGQLYIYRFPLLQQHEIAGKNWQDTLKAQYPAIIDNWRSFSVVKKFPQSFNTDSGLFENIKKAFSEIAEELEKRINYNKYPQTMRYNSYPRETFPISLVAAILKSLYIDNLTIKQVVNKVGPEYERIRDVHAKTVDSLVSGETICENIQLDKDLIEWIQIVKDQCLFFPEEKLIALAGMVDERLLKILDLDVVNITDNINFVIPRDTKNVYSRISAAVVDVLRKATIPIDKEDFFERLEHHKKIVNIVDFASDFIDNILNYSQLIKCDDGKISILDDYLSTDQQKLARIIYNEMRPISHNDILQIFENKYHRTPTTSCSNLKKFGINEVQGNLWALGRTELKPIQTFVEEFANEHKIFNFSDIQQAMTVLGYTIPASIRSYITNVCQVDNNDRYHFCHRDYVEDFPQFNWRSQNREGITNWILRKAKDYLTDKEMVSLENLTNYIENESNGTGFERRIRIRVQATISKFAGTEMPFILDNNNIRKNPDVFNKTDFNTIGLRGGKYPFFVQIRSIILNELKKSENGKISLVDSIKLINESLDEPQDRNTIIRAITNKHLPSINAEIQNIDGLLYIIYSKHKLESEPVFEIRSSSNESIPEVVESVDLSATRPEISYRLVLNWWDLQSALERELSFYNIWFNNEGINFSDAIAKFTAFIKNSENRNLSIKLPQYLYEYWFARTDIHDREMYLSQLTIFFEGLLSEIKYHNDGVRVRKVGLGDWLREFPGLANTLTLPTHLAKGFDRISKDLYYKRNKFAHGETIEMSSAETAKTISDYVALYIYTIAKYAI